MFTDFNKSLDFLDSLCRVGEEPYEIEFYVSETAKLLVPLVAAEFAKNEMETTSVKLIETFVQDLFTHIYLNSERRSRSIRALSANSLEEFLKEAIGTGADRVPFGVAIISFTEVVLSALEANQLIKGVAAKQKMLRSLRSSFEKETQGRPLVQVSVH